MPTKKVTISLTQEQQDKAKKDSIKVFGKQNLSGYIQFLIQSGSNKSDVSNRRELLLDFMTYVSPETYATHSKAELADNYLSSNSC